jgi:hypothetical protein
MHLIVFQVENLTVDDQVTQINVYWLTTVDNKFSIPIGWQGTHGISGKEILESLDVIEHCLLENQLRMVFISGDGGGSNLAVFDHYLTNRPGEVIPFADYSHLLKNIRNNIIDQTNQLFLNGVNFSAASFKLCL